MRSEAQMPPASAAIDIGGPGASRAEPNRVSYHSANSGASPETFMSFDPSESYRS